MLPPQVDVAFKVLLEIPLPHKGESPFKHLGEHVVIMVEALDEAQSDTGKSGFDNEVLKAGHEVRRHFCRWPPK